MHSLEWWTDHLEKTGAFQVEKAEPLPENDFLLKEFIKNFEPQESEKVIVEALKNDDQKLISTFRLLARRTDKTPYLDDFADQQVL